MTLGKLVKILVFIAIIGGVLLFFQQDIKDFYAGAKTGKAPETIAGKIGVTVDQGAAGFTGQTQLGALERTKIKLTDADLSTIRNGIEIYRVDHNGQLPANLDELSKSGALGGSSILRDPWGNPYDSMVSNGHFYVISAGPDKIKGTKDDQTVDMSGVKQ
jgi:hypothetical protein